MLDFGALGTPSHEHKSVNAHSSLFTATFYGNVGRKVKNAVSAFIFIILKLCKKIAVGSVTRASSLNFYYALILDVVNDVTKLLVLLDLFVEGFSFRCDCNSRSLGKIKNQF